MPKSKTIPRKDGRSVSVWPWWSYGLLLLVVVFFGMIRLRLLDFPLALANTYNAAVLAVQHLFPLRVSPAKLSDCACYVTKFQNNSQHVRVLGNEMLAARLGLWDNCSACFAVETALCPRRNWDRPL